MLLANGALANIKDAAGHTALATAEHGARAARGDEEASAAWQQLLTVLRPKPGAKGGGGGAFGWIFGSGGKGSEKDAARTGGAGGAAGAAGSGGAPPPPS